MANVREDSARASRGRRRGRRYHTARQQFGFAVLCAVLLFAVIVGAMIALGWRIERFATEEGTITFFGVIRDGARVSGKISYPDGTVGVIRRETGIIEYNNGTRYLGPLDSVLRRDGAGKMTFAGGNVYEGDFRRGAITGKGKMTYAAGDVYEGDFADGKPNGEGVYTWADGSTYCGTLTNGRPDGSGVLIGADGLRYEGGYRDGLREGDGVLTYPNGDVYTGSFRADMRDGAGVYVWANGERYEGEFKNNAITGTGTYSWPSGRTYTGTFLNGVMVKE